MAQGSDNYHEPVELLSGSTKDMHRALITVIEELEAIDWYQQRAEACTDESLKQILLHNRSEEIEHALMTIEWIRRNEPKFDEQSRTYLYSEGPITQLEAAAMGRDAGTTSDHTDGSGGGDSLGIGSLKERI